MVSVRWCNEVVGSGNWNGLYFLLLSDSRQFYEIDEFKHKILVPIITEAEKARRKKNVKHVSHRFLIFDMSS